MAIVQISKIIHRVGANIDLPQLDIGELGFSSDTRQVFIGNDPSLYPPVGELTTQTEILTDQSSIDFSRLNGASDTTMDLTSPEQGQILAIANIANIMTVVNAGANTTNEINLGDVQYLKVSGTSFNGAILQTDGTGNLSWTTNGRMMFDIANIAKTDPANVTTIEPHFFNTGAQVTLYDFAPNGTGMIELLSDGTPAGTCQFWVVRTGPYNFTLYESAALDSGNSVDATGYTDSVANTGFCVGGVPQSGSATVGGSNTQVQFNDAGALMGVSNFVFNKATNNLTVTGNLVVNTGRIQGSHVGPIGATSPNTGAFTSVTATTTIVATGNITANNVTAVSNGSGNNFKVGDDAFIGDVNIADTIQLKGVANSANAYMIFGTGDTAKLGRSGTGPLTYSGNVSITGNITTNVAIANTIALDTWSLFANVDGLFATDGANTYSINMTQI